LQALAWFGHDFIDALCSKRRRISGYNERRCWGFGRADAVVLHAHALPVRRLLPLLTLQARAAFIKRQSEATSLPCRII